MWPTQETSTNAPYSFDPALRKCTVRGAAQIPPEIFDIAEDIEILDASFGRLTALPDNLADLKNLRIAFFSNNDFESIPNVLASCNSLEMVGFKSCKINGLAIDSLPRSLRGLIMTDNLLASLPEDIGDLQNLQKLMLTGNQLSALPESLLACEKLELLRVSLNQVKTSPDWLFELPRLAWYSDSGNLFSNVLPVGHGAPIYNLSDLQLHTVLGKSAKNTVHSAQLAGQWAAVKIFGEGVTTDGAPTDDINAALLAGNHPNIIGGLGQVVGNNGSVEGLVMPLVSQEYIPLGSPPDFTTLTRDVFSEGTNFTESFMARVLQDMVSAISHLASRGIMHGDIYAHNILSNPDGRSYLGDFGASSIHPPGSRTHTMRERVEVRGFGCLIEDMLANCAAPPKALVDLKDMCLSADPSTRPTFEDIELNLLAT